MTSKKNTHDVTTSAEHAPKHVTSTNDVATEAADAVAQIKQIISALPIDDAIPPDQVTGTRVTNRVPLEAMIIAARVLAENPGQFPHFDAADAQAAIAYEQAMQPVLEAATVLTTRLGKSLLKRRAAMAQQTLALYQVMKGASRLAANEETRTQVKQLSKLFTTKRKSRATDVTQKETKIMVKTRKSAKKQAEAQAKADAASTEAAIASAQAALDAAIAAGAVPQVVTSPEPVAPPASGPTPSPPAPHVPAPGT
jgi:hypothetical protein